MAVDTRFPGWNWDDPEGLADLIDRFHEGLAHCESLEPTELTEPYTKGQLVSIGVSGIEFAAWKCAHPEGISTDVIPLRNGKRATEPGRLYRVDGERYFVELDIRKPLPFEAGCLDWVYAEHLIGHVTPPVAIRWLREVRRVLTPGGLLRLTTPDLRKYVQGYQDGGRFFATHRSEVHATGFGPLMPARAAFMLNQIFYLYGHRWIYDLDELRYVLSGAGFDPPAIRRSSFRDGARADVAALDRPVRQDETLYVEVTA